jgi:hypothetical protein
LRFQLSCYRVDYPDNIAGVTPSVLWHSTQRDDEMSNDDADRFREQAEEWRQQAQTAVSPLDKEAWQQSTDESRRRRSGDG